MDKYTQTRIETITEADFWSALRMTRELRATISLGLDGQRAEAYHRLGDYHARTLVAEADAFTTSVRKNPQPDSLKARADRVMRHEIQGWHTHVRRFGPVIDFNADFGRSGQYGFHYLGWLRPVLDYYGLTADPAYRDEFIRIIKQYYDQRTRIDRRIPSLHPVYYELGARAKTGLILPAYAVMVSDPALDTDAREAMLKLLLGFARSLYRLQAGGYRGGNWQIVGCQSLYAIGAAFPEFKEAGRWRRRAETILDEHARKDFFADGGHGERCWGYGIMSLGGMAQYYECAERYGRLDARRRSRWRRFLKRGYRWFAAASAPGRMMLNYGDGNIASAEDILESARERFPEFRRQPGVLGIDLASSNIMRPSGYAFMRDGDTPDAPFMSINFGGWGGGHTHTDLLDFTLWRYGQPLIEEVGRFGSYDNPLDPRFRAAESHNQVVLDYLAMDRRNHAGRDVCWAGDAMVDGFSAWHEAYGCARIQRQIVFIKPDAWLIYDVITAREPIFQATHCLHGVRPFVEAGTGTWRLKGRPSCLVCVADPGQIRREVTGVDYDRADYAALVDSTPAYQHERHHLRLSKWCDVGEPHPITFAVLLTPFNGRQPAVTLRSIPVKGDPTRQAGAFAVDVEGRRSVVVFNPARAAISAGRYRSDALISVRIGRRRLDMSAIPGQDRWKSHGKA